MTSDLPKTKVILDYLFSSTLKVVFFVCFVLIDSKCLVCPANLLTHYNMSTLGSEMLTLVQCLAPVAT